jgi:hypothetical protein
MTVKFMLLFFTLCGLLLMASGCVAIGMVGWDAPQWVWGITAIGAGWLGLIYSTLIHWCGGCHGQVRSETVSQ